VKLPAWLFGGGGDDWLQGGGGESILVGGDGDDRLHGGRGRSLLIGGDGRDQLKAHGDAVMIAGSTDHDANALALCAIMEEWTSSRSYSERAANLAVWLNATTVDDDGDQDQLLGGSGQDWFLASVASRRRDRVSGAGREEIITDISAW
jgi:Ca2+-binding RTX toxin-like protein